jgi:hypothetical protein
LQQQQQQQRRRRRHGAGGGWLRLRRTHQGAATLFNGTMGGCGRAVVVRWHEGRSAGCSGPRAGWPAEQQWMAQDVEGGLLRCWRDGWL